jgi:hypothetical protein
MRATGLAKTQEACGGRKKERKTMSRYLTPLSVLALAGAIVFAGCGQGDRPAAPGLPAAQAQVPPAGGMRWESKFFEFPINITAELLAAGKIADVGKLNACQAMNDINAGGWEYAGYAYGGSGSFIALFKRPAR